LLAFGELCIIITAVQLIIQGRSAAKHFSQRLISAKGGQAASGGKNYK